MTMGRREEPVAVGELVSGVLGSAAFRGNGTARAGYAWNLVAGDSGRRHTRGLFLEQREGALPILHVYLDSSPLIQDFQTDHLLYERRLQEVGLPVERVRFQLSRKAGTPVPEEVRPPVPEAVPLDSCPPLSAEDAARVEAASQDMPDALAQAFRAAMEGVLRRGAKD